jgi:cardiolipin synthase
MQVVRSSAGVGDTNVEALYYLAIAAARESLDLTAAYFAPRPAFTRALCDAADRGVKVRVLVPGRHIDKNFVRVAGRATYSELMDCGVELYEYGPTMLHAKALVLDGVWASSARSTSTTARSSCTTRRPSACRTRASPGCSRSSSSVTSTVSERIDPERWERRALRIRARESMMRLARREL